MEKGDVSHHESETSSETNTTHHLTVPPGLTQTEFNELKRFISEYHTYRIHDGQCSSLLAQRVNAPLEIVWSIIRRFDKPQMYKHFIKSCYVKEDFNTTVGCTRDVNVISGLPAETSTERLDILDDDRHVTGFSIIGGEHRLRNYRSVTTAHECNHDGKIWTVVLESYVVDMPEGNSEGDTRLFADTVVKLNLQKLASVTEGLARDGDGNSQGLVKINVDGGIFTKKNMAGVGVVVRGETGNFIAGRAMRLGMQAEVEVVEAWAIRCGLELGKDLGLNRVIMEGDAKTVMDAINKDGIVLSMAGTIIEDIRELARDFEEIHFQFIKRDANKAAHVLIREIFHSVTRDWKDILPNSIKSIVESEFIQ